MALLEENWNITCDFKQLFDELKKILKNPNMDADYCVNQEARNFWENDREKYYKIWLNMLIDGPDLEDDDFSSDYINQLYQ